MSYNYTHGGYQPTKGPVVDLSRIKPPPTESMPPPAYEKCRGCGCNIESLPCPSCGYGAMAAVRELRKRVKQESDARDRARAAAQIIIDEIGADGPMTVVAAAAAAIEAIRNMRRERDEAMGLLQEWYDDSGIQAVYTPHTGSIVGRTAALLKRMEDET